MDPSTATGSIASGVLATILGTAALGLLAWLGGPLRWWVRGRALRALIIDGRRFTFVFNPLTSYSKVITFQPDQTIGEGRNENEHTWRIRRGCLEILASDGKVYSRFRHDSGSGQLKHTNDPDLRSIHGQYMHPLLVRAPKK